MLPHNHFLISGLVIASVGFILFPEKPPIEIGKWVLIGGLVSSAVDLDIITLVILKSKKQKSLKPFRNPIEIYKKFKLFMETIKETGLLKTGMKTHIIFSSFIILFFYLFYNAYFIPVLLAVISHIISDIPNIRKVYN